MWCFVCGCEYRSGFDHCGDCDIDLVLEEPASPLLPHHTFWTFWPPVYGDRYYRGMPQPIFWSLQNVLDEGGWHVRAARGLDVLALAAAVDGWEMAAILLAVPDGLCRVRCAMQYLPPNLDSQGAGSHLASKLESFLRSLDERLNAVADQE